jgi:hypothetical protein
LKIQSLLKEQLDTTFSVGAISEAQTKVASMLTPLHQAIKQALKKAPLIHADESIFTEMMSKAFFGVG